MFGRYLREQHEECGCEGNVLLELNPVRHLSLRIFYCPEIMHEECRKEQENDQQPIGKRGLPLKHDADTTKEQHQPRQRDSE